MVGWRGHKLAKIIWQSHFAVLRMPGIKLYRVVRGQINLELPTVTALVGRRIVHPGLAGVLVISLISVIDSHYQFC